MGISNDKLNEILMQEINRASEAGLILAPVNCSVDIMNRKDCYGYNCRGRISISKYYLDAPEEELRSVICHEVCHSVKGSCGHDEKWRYAIRRMRRVYTYMNADYHLHEHPYSKDRESLPHTRLTCNRQERILFAPYVLQCKACGYTTTRERACSMTKHPELFYHISNGHTCNGGFKLISSPTNKKEV